MPTLDYSQHFRTIHPDELCSRSPRSSTCSASRSNCTCQTTVWFGSRSTLFDNLRLMILRFSSFLDIMFFILHYHLFSYECWFDHHAVFLSCCLFERAGQRIHLLFCWCNCNLPQVLGLMGLFWKICWVVKDGQKCSIFLGFLFCFHFYLSATDSIARSLLMSYSLVLWDFKMPRNYYFFFVFLCLAHYEDLYEPLSGEMRLRTHLNL